jgi:hypothetical protein
MIIACSLDPSLIPPPPFPSTVSQSYEIDAGIDDIWVEGIADSPAPAPGTESDAYWEFVGKDHILPFLDPTPNAWPRGEEVSRDTCIWWLIGSEGPSAVFWGLSQRVWAHILGDVMETEAFNKIQQSWDHLSNLTYVKDLTFDQLLVDQTKEIMLLDLICTDFIRHGNISALNDLLSRRRLLSWRQSKWWTDTVDVLQITGVSLLGGIYGTGQGFLQSLAGSTATLSGGPGVGVGVNILATEFFDSQLEQFANTVFNDPILRDTMLKSAKGSSRIVETTTSIVNQLSMQSTALKEAGLGDAYKNMKAINSNYVVRPTPGFKYTLKDSLEASQNYNQWLEMYVLDTAPIVLGEVLAELGGVEILGKGFELVDDLAKKAYEGIREGVARKPEIDDNNDDQECANESDDFMHYDYPTTPEIIKACQLLWTEGSVPKRVDAGIGGEITCRKTSYEVGIGKWDSPRPAVCGIIEDAAASVRLSGLTPGCGLWFWCTSPEPFGGEIDIQWVMNIRQTYDF